MIIIPMAGESSRFSKLGYKSLKYRLEISKRPLFDWVLLGFYKYFTQEVFIFIVRSGEKEFVKSRITKFEIKRYEIIELSSRTLGQADTVRYGLKMTKFDIDENLFIYNIDTVSPNIELNPCKDDGWIEVFGADGDHWSFVEPSPFNFNMVAKTAEKNRLSELCSTGLYCFVNGDTFLKALDLFENTNNFTELYVAPIYNNIIELGGKVSWRLCKSNIFLSGIPSDYEKLKTLGLKEELFIK